MNSVAATLRRHKSNDFNASWRDKPAASRSERTVREDLCFEAIRLALLLSEHPEGEKRKTHALLALLCFHAAR
ncbi:MAG: DUF6596 domain-containing protein, partial [Terriglobia bacterium]